MLETANSVCVVQHCMIKRYTLESYCYFLVNLRQKTFFEPLRCQPMDYKLKAYQKPTVGEIRKLFTDMVTHKLSFHKVPQHDNAAMNYFKTVKMESRVWKNQNARVYISD